LQSKLSKGGHHEGHRIDAFKLVKTRYYLANEKPDWYPTLQETAVKTNVAKKQHCQK
jgi:hypothetical protein